LGSVETQNYPRDQLELIVLDDASRDPTAKEIPEYLKRLEEQGLKKTYFFRNKRNLGIIMGRYILAKKVSSQAEMVLFVDDDAYLEVDCLKTLVEYILKHPNTGIVGPRIVYAKAPEKTAHYANFVNRWTAKYWIKESNEPIICDWVNSTCCLVKKEVLERINGFSPKYYISHAEVDFCLRAKKAGFQVVYNPQAIVQHEVNISKPKRERLYYLYRNKLLLIHRNFRFIQKVVAISLIIFLGTPKYLLESIRFHKGFLYSELYIIVLSIWHGLLGITGSRERKIN